MLLIWGHRTKTVDMFSSGTHTSGGKSQTIGGDTERWEDLEPGRGEVTSRWGGITSCMGRVGVRVSAGVLDSSLPPSIAHSSPWPSGPRSRAPCSHGSKASCPPSPSPHTHVTVTRQSHGLHWRPHDTHKACTAGALVSLWLHTLPGTTSCL